MRLAVRSPQEHPGVGRHRLRQDHLDQGADPGDSAEERLITIEDARELVLDEHPNHVRLFYSKDDQGLARVTPKQLLESCLRMKPDRILLAELRAEEAFDYLRNVNSGHPGLDHQRARGQRRAGLRAARAAGQAERRRPGAGTRGHQESAVSARRRRHPVRRRAPPARRAEIWFDPARKLRGRRRGVPAVRRARRCRDARCGTAARLVRACCWGYAAVQAPMLAGIVARACAARAAGWRAPLVAAPADGGGGSRHGGAGAVAAVDSAPARGGVLQLASGATLAALLGYGTGRAMARSAAAGCAARLAPRRAGAEAGCRRNRQGQRRGSRPCGAVRYAASRWPGYPCPLADETKHFKFIGTTGTGKSTAIRELLAAALARGDRAVIADPDGGYLRRFYDARPRRCDPQSLRCRARASGTCSARSPMTTTSSSWLAR